MSDTNIWYEFFNTAGIIVTEIPNYVDIFVENRIRVDMLPDLKKEYLKEMGINALGDVIAILRHARQFYNKNAKTSALNNKPQTKQISDKKSSPPRSNDNRSHAKAARTTDEPKARPSTVSTISKPPLSPTHEDMRGVKFNSGTLTRIMSSKTELSAGDGGIRTSRIVRLEKSSTPYERVPKTKGKLSTKFPSLESSSKNGTLSTGLTKSQSMSKSPSLLVSGTQTTSAPSIFARLGNYNKTNDFDSTLLKPKLSSSKQPIPRRATPPKRLSTPPPRKSLPTAKSQKLFLVSKVPTKTGSDEEDGLILDDDDDNDGVDISDSDEDLLSGVDLRHAIDSSRSVTVTSMKKNVKFARESEICESILTSPSLKAKSSLAIKSRLGSKNKDVPSVKRTINFKHEIPAPNNKLFPISNRLGSLNSNRFGSVNTNRPGSLNSNRPGNPNSNRLGSLNSKRPQSQVSSTETRPIKDLRQIIEKKTSTQRLY